MATAVIVQDPLDDEADLEWLRSIAAEDPEVFRKLTPHHYASLLSEGRWVAYSYLQVISEAIAIAVTTPYSKIIVEAPPRHGKSELLSRWTPTWFLDMFPGRRVMLAAHNQRLASAHGKWVRNTIKANPRVSVRLAKDSFSSHDFQTSNGGQMFCVGVGGSPTGRGADLLLIDDPYARWDDAQNPNVREEVWEWFHGDWTTRMEPNCSQVLLHTRWHEDDLAGRLQREYPGEWRVLSFPALAEYDDPNLGRQPGEALCPARFPAEILKKEYKAKLSTMQWNAEFQQRPIPLTGALWKSSYWKYWEVLPATFDELIMSCDFTFKKTARSDFVVLQVWGKAGTNRYLLDQVRDQMDFNQSVEELLRLACRWPNAFRILIENKANGPAIETFLRHKLPGMQLVEPKNSKLQRAQYCLWQLEHGHVYLPKDFGRYPWVNGFIAEAARFPTPPDDQVDAASQALIHFGNEEKANLLNRLASLGDIRNFYSHDQTAHSDQTTGEESKEPSSYLDPPIPITWQRHRRDLFR